METIKSILVIMLLSLIIIFVIAVIVDSIRAALCHTRLDQNLETHFAESIPK